MAWISPKLDWLTNPVNPTANDMARIEGNTDFLKTDIETKKGLIVDAVNTMGQTATLSNTHSELAGKIVAISSDATATVGQVLSGATFYQGGVKRIGTIPSKTAQTFTPSTVNQTISSGQYLSGIQTITGDEDLVAGNIKSGVNIFGVTGNVLDVASYFVYLPSVNYYLKWEEGYWNLNSKPTYLINNTYMRITSTIGSYSAGVEETVVTKDPVSLTGVNRIRLRALRGQYDADMVIGVSPTKITGYNSSIRTNQMSAYGILAASSSYQDVFADVSALSGNYYIYVGIQDDLLSPRYGQFNAVELIRYAY